MSDKTLDFIAVGRAGIDLYGQQAGGRLEDMGNEEGGFMSFMFSIMS